MKKKLDDFFKITERGSSISTELIGGATTFATMAYILAYMTWSMSAIPGINLTGVLICTALVTAAACLAMGLYSNTPICLAPVLVIPGLIAGWVADGTATYSQAFGIVAISGIVFILVSLFNLRELFARCLPKNLKIGLAASVGFLIARVGMNSCGLYAATESGLTYGDYHAKSTILGVIGIAICFVLTYVKFNINGREYKIRGALLIGIILTTIIGIPMGVTVLPESIFTIGGFSAIKDVAFQVDIFGALKLSFVPLFLMIPGAATGAALVVVGISMLETVKDLDFEPIEFLPVAAMWLTTVYMSDYVGGIVIGMFVYMFINIFRALFERDKKYIPSLPVWVMTALMSLYYIF